MSFEETDSRLPILGLGRNVWQDTWMNRQHLLSRLGARGWPVVYSRGALSIWQRKTEEWRRAPWFGRLLERDGVTVDEPGRWLCRWQNWPSWDRLVLRRKANQLRKALSVTDNRFIAVVFDPEFWPYVERLNADFVVYHVYDAYSRMPGWNRQFAEFESKLVERAELLTVTSAGVAGQLPGDGPRRARCLPNGVDAERVIAAAAAAPCPPDLEAIPRPRVGYVGSVNDKVDYELVAHLARARPEWHWVFVGPVTAGASFADLHDAVPQWSGLQNVHMLGARPQARAPLYAAHMDVNTICYRVDEASWANAGNPLKLYEYLAVGKPVISTDLQIVRQFQSVVRIACSTQDWLDALECAIHEGASDPSSDERQAVARLNSWDRRVDILEEWLMQVIAGREQVQRC